MSSAVVQRILTGGTLTSEAEDTLTVEAESTLTGKAGGTLASETRGALDDKAESLKTDGDTADMVKRFTAKTNDKLQVYRKKQ